MDALPAEKALLAGCRKLDLPETAAKELIRYLLVKRKYGDAQGSRLSSSGLLDTLLHWLLLNTDTRDLVERHVGNIWHTTDTAQQPDAQKMERRLSSMELMTTEDWHPCLSLWEEPGTLLSGLAQVIVYLHSGRALVKYSCVGKPLSDILQELKDQGIWVDQVRQGGQLVKFRPSIAQKRKVMVRRAPAESVLSSTPANNNAASSAASMTIIIKEQSGHEVRYRVTPTTKMGKLLASYAASREVEQKSIGLIFYGKLLKPEDTPASLGLEAGDVVDAVVEMSGC